MSAPATPRSRRVGLSFAFQLAIAVAGLVALAAGASLWYAQQQVAASYRQLVATQLQQLLDLLAERKEARLDAARGSLRQASRNLRLVAALQAEDFPLFFTELDAQLVAVVERYSLPETGGLPPRRPLYRFVTSDGRVPSRSAGVWEDDSLAERLPKLAQQPAAATIAVGYLPQADEGGFALYELLAEPVVDSYTGDYYGLLCVALPVPDRALAVRGQGDEVRSAFLVENRLYGEGWSLPVNANEASALLGTGRFDAPAVALAAFPEQWGPQFVFARAIPSLPGFPAAQQVGLLSESHLTTLLNELATLQRAALGLAVVGGLVLAVVLAAGMTRRLRVLEGAAREVRAGHLETRAEVAGGDEIARFADTFNEMVAGLELKERYRSVLDKVTDPAVAAELAAGKVALGGEVRDVAVLFCDIRGFTSLTQTMPPAEVIAMLNEHMTALTRVAKQHHGVVDKFVGDLIMVLFGAPQSYGNDALEAARCALAMQAERTRLNETSQWRFAVGIGIATGEVVAGNMGSVDRLNYTVLGRQVNLAARLCSGAAPGEVLICPTTQERLGGEVAALPKGEIRPKGFSDPVTVFALGPTAPQS